LGHVITVVTGIHLTWQKRKYHKEK